MLHVYILVDTCIVETLPYTFITPYPLKTRIWKKPAPSKWIKDQQLPLELIQCQLLKRQKINLFLYVYSFIWQTNIFSFLDGKNEVYKVQFQKLPAVFVGTGDLFAACLLAWLEKDKNLKVLCFSRSLYNETS